MREKCGGTPNSPSFPHAADERECRQQFTVARTHEYGPAKAKVFSLTLAHNGTTMADPRYLNLVARGGLGRLAI